MVPDSTSSHPPGTRVVVRYRLPEPDPATGAQLTDVVGELVVASEDAIVVDSRRGRVTVPRSIVVATRVIPPRPSRRGAPHRALSIDDLERVMVGAWPPPERDQLGQWVLRAGQGFTARANSALVVGSPDRPVTAALTAVREWYAARSLAPLLAVPIPTGLDLADDPVAAAAIGSGWAGGDLVHVLTAATRVVVETTRGSGEGRVELDSQLTESWLAGLRGYRSAPEPAARAVLGGSPDQRFATVRDGSDTVVAIGRLGVSNGWGGIGAMWVDPAQRRRGIARAVLHALAGAAADLGCVSLHLQVESANEVALSLYDRVGFTAHHSYAYLGR